MYDVEKRSAAEYAPGFVRLDVHVYIYIFLYIWSCNKMAALGYVYTLEKLTSRSPEHCTSWKASRAEFLEVQIFPCVLVHDWDS